MKYRAWFQCSAGCDVTYPLDSIVYECEKCGDLLEVRHDTEAIKQRTAGEWKELFDQRYLRTQWPYGSGVWGKKEIVCPAVDNENIISLYEGGTNLFFAKRFGSWIGLDDLWVKQCGNSHSGSFKDLGMTVLVSMVSQMRAEGLDIPAVACASTGDTSASLAAYCASSAIQAVVFLPKGKVSHAQLIQPISNGAITFSLDTDFDGCMKLVQEVCKQNNIYLANSMNSLRIEGQKTISIEIVQQFNWQVPDWIIIPGGNLGNVSALGKGFLLMQEMGIVDRLPRIVCAQAQKANPLYASYQKGFEEFHSVQARKTAASAIQIGDPVSVRKAIKILKQFNGIVEQASEEELANASAMADLSGLYCCPHTGVALAALLKLVQRKVIKQRDRVVVISTANGLKFTDFKIRYHEKRLDEVTSRYANLPMELPADYTSVRDALFQTLEERKNREIRGHNT